MERKTSEIKSSEIRTSEGKTSERKSSETREKSKVTSAFKVGSIALAFLIIGYQVALFVHSAAVTRIISNRDSPDTVFVLDESLARRLLSEDASPDNAAGGTLGGFSGARQDCGSDSQQSYGSTSRPNYGSASRQGSSGALHQSGGAAVRQSYGDASRQGYGSKDGAGAQKREIHRSSAGQEHNRIYDRYVKRPVESFSFNPNTVSVEDLVRLGFSEKQAASIDNYRRKGGRFRRKEDFAASYVVSDSVFRRLEPYINIPLLDMNSADSAAFDALPGIGPYFASKMVSYREELGGYSYKEQLMDIWRFDKEKYDGLKDLVVVDTAVFPPFNLWSASESELARHPYVGRHAARGVILYRENTSSQQLNVSDLGRLGVLTEEQAAKLARCRIAPPGP